MSRGGLMRGVLPAAVMLGLVGCAPPPGHLTLSNFRFDHVTIETVVTASSDCSAGGGAATGFELPFMGTRVIQAVPEGDICWRRQIGAGRWTDWNRAYTASGRSVDSQL